MDFDFTPILIAVMALGLFYTDYVFSSQIELSDNKKQGKVRLMITREQAIFNEEITVLVAGLEDDIEYGDYIRNLLISDGVLPVHTTDLPSNDTFTN